MAIVFAEATKCQDVWKQGLKGWQVLESMQVKEWKAEGRQEGELANQAKAVIRVLQVKHRSVPQEVTDGIRGITDYDTLDRWLELAVEADTIDDFRQAAGV